MSTIVLGNADPTTSDLEQADTVVGPLPDDTTPLEALRIVADLWPAHSGEPPAWVDGDDEAIVAVVASELGCKIGRPKRGWPATNLPGDSA